MKPLKLLGALVAAAMLTGVTNIMAYDIPVSVISDASQMKKSSIEKFILHGQRPHPQLKE